MNVALRPAPVDYISICTGGAGLDLGVELAIPGARAACLVEGEAFAVSHLVAAMEQGFLHPAPVWSDARTFDGRRWRGCVDGLVGGIPCQPWSLAGRRLGAEDERDLWSHARRILVQSGAWFVLIENVGGMLSGGGAERVWRDLCRLGFACEIGLFAAEEVGAPHERERLFILAVADSRCHGQQWRAEPHLRSIGPEQPASRRGDAERRDLDVAGVGLADACGEGLERRESGDCTRPRIKGTAAERSGGTLVHAERAERRSDADGGDDPHGHDAGRRKTADRAGKSGPHVGDSASAGSLPSAFPGLCGREEGRRPRDAQSERPGGPVDCGGLFPPGPSDILRWQGVLTSTPELEPAFRRVADGLASRMDVARVDRLRLLGNGVVPLQAAFALRTLANRLADKGHDRLWNLCQQ